MVTLKIDGQKSVSDFKKEFNHTFPFLKIELLKKASNEVKGKMSYVALAPNQPLGKDSIHLEIDDQTSVSRLKTLLLNELGIVCHVYRKSGSIWIEISLTNDWSLSKQNNEAEQMN